MLYAQMQFKVKLMPEDLLRHAAPDDDKRTQHPFNSMSCG